MTVTKILCKHCNAKIVLNPIVRRDIIDKLLCTECNIEFRIKKLTKALTAKHIYHYLLQSNFLTGQMLSIDNVHLFEFESDFLTVSKAGYMTEYEVKVSRSDFRADFKKSCSKRNARGWRLKETVHKHVKLAMGSYGLKHFYFIAPEGIIPHDEVPDHAGLIEVTRHSKDNIDLQTNIVKKAPKLPNCEKITDKQKAEISNKFYFKYNTAKLKLIKKELA